MPLGIDELIGALPDAIAWAIMQAYRAVMGEVLQVFVDYGFKPLLTVTNPATSSEAMTAWTDIRNVAIALLPLALAGSFIVWPFTLEEREVSLWQLVLRLVGILVFIAISKPLWGFAVDATNTLTVAILPETFKITFNQDVLEVGGPLLDYFLYPIAAFLLFSAFLASTVLLVLRWFLVWVAFLGTPLFAVMLYPKWGPLSSITKYGGTFIRMGVYALLCGPIIALILRVSDIVMGGGLITGQSDVAGTILELGATLAFLVILPILLYIATYKVIAWAGQPLGIGQAFSGLTAAVAAVVGTVVGAAGGGPIGGAVGGVGGASGGSAAGAGGSAAAGGATGASGGSAAAGGSTAGGGASGASGAATDPSAGTGESMVNAGVDNSIDEEIWEAADEAVEEGIDTGPAHKAAGKTASAAKKLPNLLKRGGGAVASKRDMPGQKLKNALQNQREQIVDHKAKAEQAKQNQDMLDVGGEMGDGQTIGDEPEFDVSAAKERGIFDPHDAIDEEPPPMPADDAGTVTPEADGTIEYDTVSGGKERANIHSDLKPREEAKQKHHLSKARGHAKSAEQLKAAGVGGRMAGSITGKAIKAQKTMMKAGGAAMIGAVTGHPYYGWRVGKSMGGKSYSGGAKNWLIGPNQQGQTGTATNAQPSATTNPSRATEPTEKLSDLTDTYDYHPG